MAKEDKPPNFKGVTAIMVNDFILDDACPCKGNGYNPGEIVTFVQDESDLGNKDYETPHFDVVFIKGITMLEMEGLIEELRDGDQFIERRKFKIDHKNIKVKDKAVWEKADFETPGLIIEKPLPVAPQPDNIEVG